MQFLLLLPVLLQLSQARFVVPILSQPKPSQVKAANDATAALLVDVPAVSFTAATNLTDARFRAGDKLQFYCEAVGTPMINVYWTLNGRIVQGHRRRSNIERSRNGDNLMIAQNVVGSMLELDCVDERMSGRLSCVADNGITIKKASVQIATAPGSSLCSRMRPARPQIGAWTKSRIEEIGNSVVFQCRKAAAAGASVHWENEQGEQLSKQDGFVTLPNGDLLIDNLQWEHMGSYFCVVKNESGEDRSETFIFPTDKNADAPTSNGNGDYEEY